MDAIKILIMAIFQGIGEFLPISSSGHLLVFGTLFFGDSHSFDDGDLLTLNILLHAGTLLSILLYFHRQIWDALTKSPRTLGLVAVGSVPTVAVALVMLKFFDFLAESVWVAGFGFIATGVLLLTFLREKKISKREQYFDEVEEINREERGEIAPPSPESVGKTLATMTWFDAIFIGVAQGIAVLPGVSRSGSTIAAGVVRKLSREAAATFSFLLSIPVIGGGALLETIKIVKDFKEEGKEIDVFGDPQLSLYGIGALVSFGVGLVSLIFLMRWLKAGKIHYFAYWLFLFGPLVILWQVATYLFGGN